VLQKIDIRGDRCFDAVGYVEGDRIVLFFDE
jgi:hypothetical protein